MKLDRPAAARVYSQPDIARVVEAARAAGRRIVFTNGVFDLLHPGHVRYLRDARALGDLLIVGLNADASVRRNKGSGRPINSEHERAEVLAALASVDAVVIFEEDTPAEIIRLVQPDVLVKGRGLGGRPDRRARHSRSSRGTRRAHPRGAGLLDHGDRRTHTSGVNYALSLIAASI